MAEYVKIENYTRNGAMGISHFVFDQIAEIATNKVKGASVKTNSVKRLFKVHKPISCQIRNGQVNVKIDVIIRSGANVNAVCTQIQEEVANAISSMTELVPFNVNIKVAGIE